MENFTSLIAEIVETNKLKLLMTLDKETIDHLSSLKVNYSNVIIKNYEHSTGTLDVNFYSPKTHRFLKLQLDFDNNETAGFWIIGSSVFNANVRFFIKGDSLPNEEERNAINVFFKKVMSAILDIKKKESFTCAK